MCVLRHLELHGEKTRKNETKRKRKKDTSRETTIICVHKKKKIGGYYIQITETEEGMRKIHTRVKINVTPLQHLSRGSVSLSESAVTTAVVVVVQRQPPNDIRLRQCADPNVDSRPQPPPS